MIRVTGLGLTNVELDEQQTLFEQAMRSNGEVERQLERIGDHEYWYGSTNTSFFIWCLSFKTNRIHNAKEGDAGST